MSKNIVELNDSNFKKEIIDYKGVAVVDFWAAWCGPCKVMGPVVDEIADNYNGRLKVAKMNVEDNHAVASQLGIMNIPTFVFFKSGKEHSRFSGAVPKKELERRIKEALGA